MKKTVLMALLTIAIMGCKKSEGQASSKIEEVATTQCETSLSEYLKIPVLNVKERAEWLKLKGKEVYPAILFKFVFDEHLLTPGTYQRETQEYGQQIPLEMTWKNIKSNFKEHYYDKYVSFKEVDGGRLELVLVDEFSTDYVSCYSIPLFLSIADKLQLDDDDESTIFEFSKTNMHKSKIKTYVIFKVTSPSMVHEFEMNYSTKPTAIDFLQNPL